MSDSLEQPNSNRFVESVTTDRTSDRLTPEREKQIRNVAMLMRGMTGESERTLSLLSEIDALRVELAASEKAQKEAVSQTADVVEQSQRHLKAVSRFLSEMYATMIDPLDDGERKVAETCEALLKQAREDRESLLKFHEQSAQIIALQLRETELTEALRLVEQHYQINELGREMEVDAVIRKALDSSPSTKAQERARKLEELREAINAMRGYFHGAVVAGVGPFLHELLQNLAAAAEAVWGKPNA